MIADELRCSVLEAAAADPSWRTIALTVLRAKSEAREQQTMANGA